MTGTHGKSLADELRELSEQEVGANDLQILGGTLPDTAALSALSPLLDCWDDLVDGMEYLLLETTTAATWYSLAGASSPVEHVRDVADQVRRLRLFGPAGDFEVLRREPHFRWRYLGTGSFPGDLVAPAGGDNSPLGPASDFWAQHGSTTFYSTARTAFLWGTYDADRGRWYSPQVAKAKLAYPLPPASSRAQLHYVAYSTRGHVAFTRFVALEEVASK